MPHFSYKKALAFVALVAWAATSVIIAEAMPGDVIHSSQIMDTLNVTDSGLSKRRLTTFADMNANSHGYHSEERAILLPLSSMLRNSIIEKNEYKEIATSLLPKYRIEGKLENRAFQNWVNAVMKKATEIKVSKPMAYDAMFKALKELYGAAVIDLLVAETKNYGGQIAANDLLNFQFVEWAQSKRDPAEVFRLLDLKNNHGNFDSQLFKNWNTYVFSFHGDNNIAAQKAKIDILKQYIKEEDLKAALRRTKNQKLKGIIQALAGSSKSQSAIDSKELPAAATVRGEKPVAGELPGSSKRQHAFRLNELPEETTGRGKKRIAEELPGPSKRQHTFDLNELPEGFLPF